MQLLPGARKCQFFMFRPLLDLVLSSARAAPGFMTFSINQFHRPPSTGVSGAFTLIMLTNSALHIYCCTRVQRSIDTFNDIQVVHSV